jgi:hypothetical protein
MGKKRHIIALSRQSLVDIALTDGGEVEAMYDLAVRNGIADLPHLLTPGHKLVSEAEQLDTDVVKFYGERPWKPITGKIVPAPYVCVGDQVTVALPDGGTVTVNVESSTTHITFGRPEADPLTVGVGSSNTVTVTLEPGNYCLWPSDVNGDPTGTIRAYIINQGQTLVIGGVLTWLFNNVAYPFSGQVIDLRQVEPGTYDWLHFTAPNCTTVLIPVGVKFNNFLLAGAQLNEASVDACCNAMDPSLVALGNIGDFSGGTSAAPTAASEANRTAYTATGATLLTN